jgi:predicted Zn-dependent peptidase
VPEEELAKAKAYLGGGLELRMDETRHVASWLGGQESLHEDVLTVDEALARIATVTADDIVRLARTLLREDALRLAVVAPRGYGTGLDDRLRLAEAVA